MDNIYARTKFLTKNTVDGVQEYDLGSFNPSWYDFGKITKIYVTTEEIGRPDLISYKCYGTDAYWWFIPWYNGISDVWNDLRLGLVLDIPDITRVKEFLRLKQNGQL